MISPKDAGELNDTELAHVRKMEANIDKYLGLNFDLTTQNPVTVPFTEITKNVDYDMVTTRTFNYLRQNYITGNKDGAWQVTAHNDKWVFVPREPKSQEPSQNTKQVADRPAADVLGEEPLETEEVDWEFFPFPDHT